MNYNKDLENFIVDKFQFKTFEIDNWFANKRIYRYKYKEHSEEISNELGIDYLRNDKIDSWRYIDNHAIDYFFGEFLWYMTLVQHVKSGIKSKKEIYKKLIFEIIQNQAEVVLFDKRIKPFVESQRIKVPRVRPLPTHLRKPVEAMKIGDKCFIFRYSEGIAIVDPCLVYDIVNGSELMYHVMYFTNFGDYGSASRKLGINGYGFATVYPTEIGLTPEEAVRNKY